MVGLRQGYGRPKAGVWSAYERGMVGLGGGKLGGGWELGAVPDRDNAN
jgi:hypothetical protein